MPLRPSARPALTVTATALPLTVSSPPLTTAPRLSAPALEVVPEGLVSRPDTVLPTLLLKVPEVVNVPVMAALLDSKPALTTPLSVRAFVALHARVRINEQRPAHLLLPRPAVVTLA